MALHKNEWDKIQRRLEIGANVSDLAHEFKVTTKAIYNFIEKHDIKRGKEQRKLNKLIAEKKELDEVKEILVQQDSQLVVEIDTVFKQKKDIADKLTAIYTKSIDLISNIVDNTVTKYNKNELNEIQVVQILRTADITTKTITELTNIQNVETIENTQSKLLLDNIDNIDNKDVLKDMYNAVKL